MADETDETPDLSETLAESAAGPAQMSIGGDSASEHPLPGQIAAAKFQMANQAAARKGAGLRLFKLVPHGAVLSGGER